MFKYSKKKNKWPTGKRLDKYLVIYEKDMFEGQDDEATSKLFKLKFWVQTWWKAGEDGVKRRCHRFEACARCSRKCPDIARYMNHVPGGIMRPTKGDMVCVVS